jgi:DNA-binding NarL/FixJ family response regulator
MPMISAHPDNALPRLMIADDDPAIQSLLDASLSSGFDVVGLAADDEAAVKLAEASKPDAALVDVAMSAGAGLRAVRGIHEVAPDTAIVVLSAAESDGAVRDLLQAGANAYLRKGVAPEFVADALLDSIYAHAVDRHTRS